MAYTQASNKAVQKYSVKTYDQIKVLVKKGDRDKIKFHAAQSGESLNGYINRLIAEDLARVQDGRNISAGAIGGSNQGGE